MKVIPLSRPLYLGLEPRGRKIRLVILNENEEVACRMESFGKLKTFASTPSGQIFKGRLQLCLEEEKIFVILKDEITGSLSVTAFRNALSEMKHLAE